MSPARTWLAVVVTLLASGGGCKKTQPIAERDAEKIFATQCSKCHGPDGSGVPEQKKKLGVRDLTDAAWQKTVADAQLIQSITRGKKNMPSWGHALDEEQIAALVKKVRSLAKSPQ